MADTTRPKRYRMVSKFYKETYGEKVYKLPVALPLTCPNRDGSAGVGRMYILWGNRCWL